MLIGLPTSSHWHGNGISAGELIVSNRLNYKENMMEPCRLLDRRMEVAYGSGTEWNLSALEVRVKRPCWFPCGRYLGNVFRRRAYKWRHLWRAIAHAIVLNKWVNKWVNKGNANEGDGWINELMRVNWANSGGSSWIIDGRVGTLTLRVAGGE